MQNIKRLPKDNELRKMVEENNRAKNYSVEIVEKINEYITSVNLLVYGINSVEDE